MLFVVRFADRPDRADRRKEFLAAHLEWLDQHRDRVLIAGSLREELDGQPSGGLWIVEADSKATIDALIHTDPFWIHELRQGYEVLHWSKAFPDRKVPV